MTGDQDTSRLAAARRRWLVRYLNWARAAGQRIPSYGSPAWARLDDRHPHKLTAALVAGEAWASTGDDLPMLLDVEIRQARADEDFLLRVEHAAWARNAVTRGHTSYAELQRLRGRAPVTTPPLPASPADTPQDAPR